jgi:hypothetical protein
MQKKIACTDIWFRTFKWYEPMIIATKWFSGDKIKQQTKYKYGDATKTKEKPKLKNFLFILVLFMPNRW